MPCLWALWMHWFEPRTRVWTRSDLLEVSSQRCKWIWTSVAGLHNEEWTPAALLLAKQRTEETRRLRLRRLQHGMLHRWLLQQWHLSLSSAVEDRSSRWVSEWRLRQVLAGNFMSSRCLWCDCCFRCSLHAKKLQETFSRLENTTRRRHLLRERWLVEEIARVRRQHVESKSNKAMKVFQWFSFVWFQFLGILRSIGDIRFRQWPSTSHSTNACASSDALGMHRTRSLRWSLAGSLARRECCCEDLLQSRRGIVEAWDGNLQHGFVASREHSRLHWIGHDVEKLLHSAVAHHSLLPARLPLRSLEPNSFESSSNDYDLLVHLQRVGSLAHGNLWKAGKTGDRSSRLKIEEHSREGQWAVRHRWFWTRCNSHTTRRINRHRQQSQGRNETLHGARGFRWEVRVV